MLAGLELSLEVLAELKDRATKHGLIFFSAPFDEESADVLDALAVALFKVPSGEITNLPLLRHVAAKGRPIILSTGMADLEEVGQAVAAIRAAGDPPLAVLHCLSAYPAPVGEVNLRAMDSLARASAARSASQITRSASDCRRGGGCAARPSSKASHARQDPAGTRPSRLPRPRGVRRHGESAIERESALGDGVKRPMPSEADTRRVARKSLVAARALKAGERVAAGDLASKRPGTGISPAELPRVLGLRLTRDVAADEVIPWEALAKP